MLTNLSVITVDSKCRESDVAGNIKYLSRIGKGRGGRQTLGKKV